MIYLDYAATTPPDKSVLNTFNKVSTDYPANANSLHKLGLLSKELEEYSTNKIKEILNLKNKEIIYTSGATESNNLAIKGICERYQNRGRHIITTLLEHSSVIESMKYLSDKGFTIDYVKITDDGIVDIDDLKRLLTNDTILVSICAVDSELGLVQPIEEIGSILKDYPKCFFHVDCTQAIGKIKINFENIDLASISAHKIFGLKGIGLLIKNDNIAMNCLIHGGKSTTIYRSGTPPLPLIVSTMKALELALAKIEENYGYVENLNKKVIDKLSTYPNLHINSTINSIPYTVNFSINKIKSETFIHAMDEYDIFISTKSACSKVNTMSNAVYAVTKNREYAMHSIRVSISYLTKEEEIDEFLSAFDTCYHKLNLKR